MGKRYFIMRTCSICGREYKAKKQEGRVFRSPCRWCGTIDYSQSRLERGRLLIRGEDSEYYENPKRRLNLTGEE